MNRFRVVESNHRKWVFPTGATDLHSQTRSLYGFSDDSRFTRRSFMEFLKGASDGASMEAPVNLGFAKTCARAWIKQVGVDGSKMRFAVTATKHS